MCVHFWYPSIDLILSCKGNQPEPLNFHSLCCINPKVFLGDTLLVCKQVLNVSPRCPLASKRNLVRWKGMNPYEVIPPIPQCCNQNICLCVKMPNEEDLNKLNENTVLIGILNPLRSSRPSLSFLAEVTIVISIPLNESKLS